MKVSESLLGPLLRDVLEKQAAFVANPLGDWSELVGEQVARYSQPRSLKKKVLVVIAYDSIWKHHLELNRDALLQKINKNRADSIVVEKLVIRVGELSHSSDVINSNHQMLQKMSSKRFRPKRRKKCPLRQLTEEEKDLLKKLPDPDLRTVGARLLRRIPADEP